MTSAPSAFRFAVAFALALVPFLSRSQTEASSLRGVGLEERLDQDSLPRGLDASAELPLYVRLAVPRGMVQTKTGSLTFERLDARLDALRPSRVILTLEGAPGDVEEARSFARYAEAVARRYRDRVEAYVVEMDPNGTDDALFAYLLKLVSVGIGAVDRRAILLASGSASLERQRLESLYDEGIGPYVDGWLFTPAQNGRAPDRRTGEARRVIEERDPGTSIGRGSIALEGEGATAAIETLASLSAGVPLTLFSASPESARAVVELARGIADVLTHDVLPLDARERDVQFNAPGGSVESALFYDATVGVTHLFYWSAHAAPGATVQISLAASSPDAPRLRDPLGGERLAAVAFHHERERRTSRVRVPLAPTPLLLQIAEPAASTSVAARLEPSVEEIIARHREAERRQDAHLESYLASARDAIHFRTNPTDPGFDVLVTSRFYHDREHSELEELSFSVNGATWRSDRPAFPLLQPEKVLSLPLELDFEEDYVYRLLGIDRLGDDDCYLIGIEPSPSSEVQSLYRGRVWIDVESFRKRRLELVQTHLSSIVVSNEEVHTYEPVARDAEGEIFLLTRSSRKQIVLLAGRNILIERETRYSDFEINAPDFLERRRAARRSDHIMMRDTDDGMRYLVQRGGERVLSEELTPSAKALAMGTYVDPSFDYPLPILGLNYLDFDFMGKDAQLALLFGGVLAFGNLQKPRVFGSPLDVSFDFFGIAVKSDDKVFDPEGEDEARELRRLPGSVGLNLGWQFTPFQKIATGYELRYDFFAPGPRTSEDFVAPSDTATGSALLRYELKRRGYALTAFGSYSRRARWEPWGDLERFDPESRTYTKYSLTLGKDFFIQPFQKIHFDLGYFGGERLDRFSRYQFGIFDETRIHGVPSTALRFEELFLARAAYAFKLFDVYRFDLFLDHAVGDDPSGVSDRVRLTGVGTALSLRGPWSTILRIELGKSFLPERFRAAGTFTAQVLLLKPL